MKRWLLGLTVVLGAAAASAAPQPGGLPLHWMAVHPGVRVGETTEQPREALGGEAERGALVLEVERNGPADEGGLRAGDVVTRIGGEAVGEAGDILDTLRERKPGD